MHPPWGGPKSPGEKVATGAIGIGTGLIGLTLDRDDWPALLPFLVLGVLFMISALVQMLRWGNDSGADSSSLRSRRRL